MICPSCGMEIPDGIVQCPNCGYQFQQVLDQPDMSMLQQVQLDPSNLPFTPFYGEQLITAVRYIQYSVASQTYYPQSTPSIDIGGIINIGGQPQYNNPQTTTVSMYIYGALYITNMRMVFHAQTYSCPRCFTPPAFNPYVDAIWYNPQAIQTLIQTYKGQDPNAVDGVNVKTYKGHIIIQVSKQFNYDGNGNINVDRDILIIPGGRVDFLERLADSLREDFKNAFGNEIQATLDQLLSPDLVSQISQMSQCINNNYDQFKQEAMSNPDVHRFF
ncbi:zinc ribbon domain-containing protein [Sulfolobus sp. S-194]|uniref:zinc ribbon domain-containing protein n=1 Tax=Sulfolobus sp. S-194 TaxID=2512240 RepID=UPI001436E712|nr:zinc ribbon domain-containing protein [Sulfolobus sp. S-194]QIW22800.1 zinc ribbon domain-containing protein [Sulfolobus sp. S-194]